MEVIIKNTENKKQRAIVFGYKDDCWKDINHKKEEPSFFDYKTDDSIEIEIDGEKSLEGRLKILHRISTGSPIHISNIEYTSNIRNLNCFMCLRQDANGKTIIDVIVPTLHPNQEDFFPIIISEIKQIDSLTSLLFILEPKEEIKLNIVEKQIVRQTAKV